MLIVKDCIVSDHLADLRFACDLAQCRGRCCVEGDSGAPLREEEVAELQKALPDVLPYMTDQGREAVARQGVAVRDKDGDLGTPLVEGRECAFTVWDTGGIALCAIEKAFREKYPQGMAGDDAFLKPVSCHLYPVRVEEYGEFTAVNYHEWEVCRCAVAKANHRSQPLYQYLREPLIRRFGKEWYDELVREIGNRNLKPET